MILIDYNAIAISNVVTQKLDIDENLIRHMILNSIRMYNKKHRDEYGQVVICADGMNTWRKEFFPEYKAHRRKNRDESDQDWNEIFRILHTVRDEIRGRAKKITAKRRANYVEGRLGLIIDGTGKDYDKIAKQATQLKQLGYDVHMIFVNTSLDTALKRNAKRPRSVPRSIVTKSWNDVQKNMGKFSQYFRQNFMVVDNNDSEEDVMGPVFKQVMSLAKKKVQNKTGQQWIAMELQKKKR